MAVHGRPLRSTPPRTTGRFRGPEHTHGDRAPRPVQRPIFRAPPSSRHAPEVSRERGQDPPWTQWHRFGSMREGTGRVTPCGRDRHRDVGRDVPSRCAWNKSLIVGVFHVEHVAGSGIGITTLPADPGTPTPQPRANRTGGLKRHHLEAPGFQARPASPSSGAASSQGGHSGRTRPGAAFRAHEPGARVNGMLTVEGS
jgi:hypothetical protein